MFFCCGDDPSQFSGFLREAVGVVNDILDDRELLKKHYGQQQRSATTAEEDAFVKQAAGIVNQILVRKNGNNIQRASDVQFDDGSNIPLSSCTGNKKSLFIGINYFGSDAELRGCINDVHNIKKFVTREMQFPTDRARMRTLTDDGRGDGLPTRRNILQAFQWLVQGARANDSLFVHYSGHGGTQADQDGDEPDGQDETLIPLD